PSGRAGRRLRQDPDQLPEALGTVLDGLVRSPGWEAGVRLGRLVRRWPEVAGERLGADSEPIGLENGVLVVRCSSAAWAAQVRFLAGQLKDRTNEVLGRAAIREVRVVADLGGRGC